MATITNEVITVSLIAATASGSEIASQKAPALVEGAEDDGAERDQHDDAEPRHHDAAVSTSPPKARKPTFGGDATAVSADGGVIAGARIPSSAAHPAGAGCP